MGLQQDFEQLKTTLNQILKVAAEIQQKTSLLLESGINESSTHIECILDDCFHGLTTYKKAIAEVEQIQAAIGTRVLFAAGISAGLPPLAALKIANVPGNAVITRNITDLSQVGKKVPDFHSKEARKQLSKVWMTTALGDQGETSVLKTLVDPNGQDRIEPTDIILKPHNLRNHSGASIKPDFYCESRQLICDAKAWKEIVEKRDMANLRGVAEKYADALKPGGEVRLYFPKDTYEKQQQLLAQLPKEYNSVKVKVMPMEETYQDLQNSRSFFYQFIKYLGMK